MHRTFRFRVGAPVMAIAALLLVAASAAAATPYVRQASGTYTTVENDALVTFDSKAYSSGVTKGSIDFYLGDFDGGTLRVLGTALCSGTVDSTSAWTIYASTNLGTADNPEFAYLFLWYRDGGKSNDGAIAYLGFDLTSGCSASGPALVAEIIEFGEGPRTVSGGNITIKK